MPSTRRLVLLATLLVAAWGCNSPSPSASSIGTGVPTAEPSSAASGPTSSPTEPETSDVPSAPAASPGASPSPTAPVGVVPTAVPPDEGGPAFTPPPAMEPQADQVCLAVIPRDAAETALGATVGNIVAEATDPSIQLTCRYEVGSAEEALLVTMSSEDPLSAFERDVAIATSHDQLPENIEGLGDRAFYAAAARGAPEQLVFTKGPVIARLWNQTSATAGQAGLAELAATVAGIIDAEVRPAP